MNLFPPSYDFYTRIVEEDSWQRIAASYGITKENNDVKRIGRDYSPGEPFSRVKKSNQQNASIPPTQKSTVAISHKTLSMSELNHTIKESFEFLSLSEINHRLAVFQKAADMLSLATKQNRQIKGYNQEVSPDIILLKHFFNDLVFALNETLQKKSFSSNNTIIYQAA